LTFVDYLGEFRLDFFNDTTKADPNDFIKALEARKNPKKFKSQQRTGTASTEQPLTIEFLSDREYPIQETERKNQFPYIVININNKNN
jgi:hypothetical protein